MFSTSWLRPKAAAPVVTAAAELPSRQLALTLDDFDRHLNETVVRPIDTIVRGDHNNLALGVWLAQEARGSIREATRGVANLTADSRVPSQLGESLDGIRSAMDDLSIVLSESGYDGQVVTRKALGIAAQVDAMRSKAARLPAGAWEDAATEAQAREEILLLNAEASHVDVMATIAAERRRELEVLAERAAKLAEDTDAARDIALTLKGLADRGLLPRGVMDAVDRELAAAHHNVQAPVRGQLGA